MIACDQKCSEAASAAPASQAAGRSPVRRSTSQATLAQVSAPIRPLSAWTRQATSPRGTSEASQPSRTYRGYPGGCATPANAAVVTKRPSSSSITVRGAETA